MADYYYSCPDGMVAASDPTGGRAAAPSVCPTPLALRYALCYAPAWVSEKEREG